MTTAQIVELVGAVAIMAFIIGYSLGMYLAGKLLQETREQIREVMVLYNKSAGANMWMKEQIREINSMINKIKPQ